MPLLHAGPFEQRIAEQEAGKPLSPGSLEETRVDFLVGTLSQRYLVSNKTMVAKLLEVKRVLKSVYDQDVSLLILLEQVLHLGMEYSPNDVGLDEMCQILLSSYIFHEDPQPTSPDSHSPSSRL